MDDEIYACLKWGTVPRADSTLGREFTSAMVEAKFVNWQQRTTMILARRPGRLILIPCFT
ncbi:hypothetical protein M514_05335 [Trichuris suis]|uniref:Uncharacterized protein n=1 Tax=Trichuris suis TaxID=68888 RepID=A0A085NQ76_9BILA|nr:hypothetical protein M513_05335 [Trichuris suis]KFD71622.1 hypothetical protein M514_05335 [Trichuris suis]